MPRRKLCRWVAADPSATFFKPRGVPMSQLERVVLEMDELEALKLADFEGRYHEDAAAAMGVSRQTFGRIVETARRKVADALLHGKALVIEPGGAVARGRPNEEQDSIERSSGMKVAVTSEGDGLDARVDPRFGRCAKFVVVDTETMAHETVGNEAESAGSGAGISAAQSIVRLGVNAVVSGSCGPKAYSVLSGAGIAVHTGASGTVREAVEAFKAGKLASADGPNAASHSGMRG